LDFEFFGHSFALSPILYYNVAENHSTETKHMMNHKLHLSQIYLPQSKQALNYVSLFETEVRTDTPASILVVLEVRGDRKQPAPRKAQEFDRLSQAIVRAVKNTYLAETKITEETFEKALNSANNDLSNLARHGVVGWYKKLNALIAVFCKNELHVASAGGTSAFLLRDRQFTRITDEAAGERPHPLKTFNTFSSGVMEEDDFVILSTSGLFNFVALEKLRKLLDDHPLDRATREIIETLKVDAPSTEAFSAFFCQVRPRLRLTDEELGPLMTPASHTIIEDGQELRRSNTTRFFRAVEQMFRSLGQKLAALFSRILRQPSFHGDLKTNPEKAMPKKHHRYSKKTMLAVFLVVLVLLAGNLVFFNFRNSQLSTQREVQSVLDSAQKHVSDAEAAMIYDDQRRALDAATAARGEIQQVVDSKLFPNETKQLSERIDKIYNQLNKIAPVSDLTVLGKFSGTPDKLIKTPDGFLGFNSVANAFERYLTAGSVISAVGLSAPAPEKLVAGAYFPHSQAYGFLGTDGEFYELNPDAGTLKPFSATSTAGIALKSPVGLEIYLNKAYTIDAGSNQIIRFSQAGRGFGAGQNWLKESADLSGAKSLAVDGSVWILLSDRVLKFDLGKTKSFSLPALSKALSDGQRIYTASDLANLYIADTGSGRLIIVTKTGKLITQLTSDKFSDLRDFWADEKNKTIFAIIGQELVRFKF
jgi:hypothetical protein